MKIAIVSTVVVVSLVMMSASAFAYRAKREADGQPCTKDGGGCIVYCDTGVRAGEMYWNGSVWTDDVKWDEDFDREARKICDANGTDCK